MRSTTSSNEIMTIVRDNFKRFWTVPAFCLFLFLVSGFVPVVLLGTGDGLVDFSMISFNENVGYVPCMLILAIGSGMTVFSYLQSPSAANYVHSLPISRSKLFVANVLSGLLMIAAPIVINGIIMSIVGMNALFITWTIVTFICCAAMFAITVFAAMISGNTLMHLFNAGFFNGVLTMILVVILAVCDSLLVGYETQGGLLDFILRSNALTAAIGETSRSWICLAYLAVTAAFLIIAWLIYKKRPIERSGNSLIFSWTRALLFLICVSCGAILSGLFFATILSADPPIGFNKDMIVGLVLGGLAVFVVGSVLIDRSAKIFTKRNILPAAIALGLAFAVTLGMSADVLGYNKYVPEASEVKSVCIDTAHSELFNSYDGDYSLITFRGESVFYKEAKDTEEIAGMHYPGFSSEESINAVIALQQALINQERNDMTELDCVKIIYELNNGKHVTRSYNLYVPPDSDQTSFDLDPAIRKAAGDLYESKEFKQIYSLNNLKDDYFEKGGITYCVDYDEEDPNDGFYAISNKDVEGLKEAMEKDFQELGYDKAFQYKGVISIIRKDNNTYDEDSEEAFADVLDIPIPKDAKHTKAWLKEHEDLWK